MSEHSTPDERTEMPTGRRMEQLRKEGQMHLSTEVVTVLSLATGFLILTLIWRWLLDDVKSCIQESFKMIADNEPFTQKFIYDLTMDLLYKFAPDLIIITLSIALISSLAVMLQTNWCVKAKKVEFKFTTLNPINGVKRIISIQGVVNTLKAILKLILILPIGFFALKNFAPYMIGLIHVTVEEVLEFTGMAIMDVFWKVMYVLIALAIFDFFWTKYQWLRQNKMTKEEVKDERKAVEGDEATKKKIQAKGLSRIMQRIRDSVPQADVVITNPTHYAIALKYDRDEMRAPQVVAKGKGFLAQRIKELARNSNVPILERKALARALYNSTEVGTEIPHELFKAVAEVLAYVYRLKNPYGYMNGVS